MLSYPGRLFKLVSWLKCCLRPCWTLLCVSTWNYRIITSSGHEIRLILSIEFGEPSPTQILHRPPRKLEGTQATPSPEVRLSGTCWGGGQVTSCLQHLPARWAPDAIRPDLAACRADAGIKTGVIHLEKPNLTFCDLQGTKARLSGPNGSGYGVRYQRSLSSSFDPAELIFSYTVIQRYEKPWVCYIYPKYLVHWYEDMKYVRSLLPSPFLPF